PICRLESVFKIAKYLNVTMDWLVLDEEDSSLPSEAISLWQSYESLDERGQRAIRLLLSHESSYSEKEKKMEESLPSLKPRVKIPVYTSPAAAGEALPILSNEYTLVDAHKVPPRVAFGIRISGDSMEPEIKDGSVVWVRNQETLYHDDIGIFTLNGESLCKQLYLKDGKCRLISLNPHYAPIDIGDNDDLRVVGKVIR
ncbi:MAG TPA: hypothetical protein DCY74_06865, partial [Clostridiales bacterium]|nr:hypothetical protein [Clostridiales bacterium]